MFDKIIEKLPIVSCQEATRLMSLSMERRLSVRETIDLKMHLYLCVFCVRFLKQIKGLRQTLRCYRFKLPQTLTPSKPRLSEAAKIQIKQSLIK